MFLVKPLIFLCLLCLGIGSGVLSELSDEVDDVLMLESDELLSLNRLSSETRRLDASGFSVVGAEKGIHCIENRLLLCNYRLIRQ